MSPTKRNLGFNERRFAKPRPADTPGSVKREEPVTLGVPLVKLIKRRLVPSPEIVLLSDPRSLASEKFRRLRTVLANQLETPQVIMVSSACPGEGKTTVALNLALAFAWDRSEKTLLIDADLRRPSIGTKLHPEPQLGFAEVLRGEAELDHVILQLENTGLDILPDVTRSPEPMELLCSNRARDLIPELKKQYQRIIIDTPPLLAFTDADIIGRFTDGAIFVVRSGATSVSECQQASQSLTSTKILGIVLNDATYSLADRERYAYAYAKYYDDKQKR
jgi:capsular exopolysaccharide synthesis family protein